ncbi:MAG: glycosyltransferase family 2 protein [Gammaproteobacteria bacterium]|nr:glycosyltransferase family 2 protein [Gammaproteobacteria bacterium]HJP05554.1 glycosyltransferase family 2 protein [Gammaproteobacteria bacterium]
MTCDDRLMQINNIEIAVLVPCYNEEAAIAGVVHDFRKVLPQAPVYVYDNNSTDGTVEAARAAGAVVRSEPLQGKGNVVRRMFADIEADIYVMVDGDNTYDSTAAPVLIQKLLDESLDLVNGKRVHTETEAYRAGHQFGNVLLTSLVATIFGKRFEDMLSGYKVFSRRFVKSFPSLSSGFEIETELTVHALELRMPVAEVETQYGTRPEGSESKLSTFTDGFRILKMIAILIKEERPLQFFSGLFGLFVVTSIILAIPVVSTYLETGLVPRFPTAILATGMMLLGFLCLACGLILDTVTRGRQELKRLQYLNVNRSG